MANASNQLPLNRLADPQRIQKLIDEISARPGNRGRSSSIEADATTLLMEYAIELTGSIIEASSALAKHRDSTTIQPEDVNLILGILD